MESSARPCLLLLRFADATEIAKAAAAILWVWGSRAKKKGLWGLNGTVYFCLSCGLRALICELNPKP